MGHIIACMINRADLLEDAVRAEQDALATPPAGDHDGWGVGFYQAGEVLHKKHPQGSGDALEWAGMLHGVRSHVAIAHVREAAANTPRADNNHPFRMRQWLFAHAGSVDGFGAMQERLLASMPDFLRRNIRGDTDSEHLFHVLLSFLHDAGQLDGIDVADQAVLAAMRSTVNLVDNFSNEIGAPKGNMNLVLTNGRQLYAMRRGGPMVVVERDRLSLPERSASETLHPSEPVRYVLIGTSTRAAQPGYRPIGDARLLATDRDLRVTEYAL
jgi:predicted glutamine amidotransferase